MHPVRVLWSRVYGQSTDVLWVICDILGKVSGSVRCTCVHRTDPHVHRTDPFVTRACTLRA